MQVGLIKGAFAHVVGTFNKEAKSGTIDYVTPVGAATESADLSDEDIHLIGTDDKNELLFDKIVNPQRNSCSPQAQLGTYEEFVPVTPELRTIQLKISGSVAAEFKRGDPLASVKAFFGAADPSSPHRASIRSGAELTAKPNVSYAVQAKRSDADNWQTLAVGLSTPDASIDFNQFPGAKGVDVRVLQSDGFSETEILRDSKRF